MNQQLSWQERGNKKIQNQNLGVTCVWCIWLEQTPSHPSTSQPRPMTGVPSKNHGRHHCVSSKAERQSRDTVGESILHSRDISNQRSKHTGKLKFFRKSLLQHTLAGQPCLAAEHRAGPVSVREMALPAPRMWGSGERHVEESIRANSQLPGPP